MHVKKSLFFRLFRAGGIPGRLRPVLESEGIVVLDEGMSGWFKTKNVKGPGKRWVRRSEGFSACLAITRKRLICYTFWKRQINIAVDDPKLSELHFCLPDEHTLSIFFESSAFRNGWEGVIEYRFKTEKAMQFGNALTSIGARQAPASDAGKPRG